MNQLHSAPSRFGVDPGGNLEGKYLILMVWADRPT
ncbi:hypothetical protein GPROT2_02237 [Gammaproteobacteria bacterium]|nr:hypothetical protein GPROT2_02237 [Gammaproteobacteria bacterium]